MAAASFDRLFALDLRAQQVLVVVGFDQVHLEMSVGRCLHRHAGDLAVTRAGASIFEMDHAPEIRCTGRRACLTGADRTVPIIGLADN